MVTDPLRTFYNDGPDWPTTPTLREAELAYREAFLTAARETLKWSEPDDAVFEAAWSARCDANLAAKIMTPEGVRYKMGHEVAASRTRGRAQAFWIALEHWDELVNQGMRDEDVVREVLAPWVERVEAWAAREIDPTRISPPPRPDERPMPKPAPPAVPKTRIRSRRIADVQREVLEWLWPGRIPLGKLTLLAGDPGLGKSFVTLDIAARVSRGKPWPDNSLLRQTAGGVILFNSEDDLADTIAPRLDAAGADDTRIVAVEGVEIVMTEKAYERTFSLEVDLPRLEEMLEENPGTRLVVIDPISAYCGNIDTHKNAEVRSLLAPLSSLAGHRRVAILAITHLTKGTGTKAVYRAMGSLAFAAAARAVWVAAKDPGDPQRRLFLPAKLNLAQDPDGLAYRLQQGRVEWESGPVRMHADDVMAAEAADAGRGKTRHGGLPDAAAWLQSVLTEAPIAANDILERGDQAGFSKRTLQRAFRELGGEPRKDGFAGGWTWALPSPQATA